MNSITYFCLVVCSFRFWPWWSSANLCILQIGRERVELCNITRSYSTLVARPSRNQNLSHGVWGSLEVNTLFLEFLWSLAPSY